MPVCWTLGKRAAELQKKVDVRKRRRNEEEGRPSNFWIYRCSIRNVFEKVLRFCHIPIPGHRKLQHWFIPQLPIVHRYTLPLSMFFHWSTSSCLPSCLFIISRAYMCSGTYIVPDRQLFSHSYLCRSLLQPCCHSAQIVRDAFRSVDTTIILVVCKCWLTRYRNTQLINRTASINRPTIISRHLLEYMHPRSDNTP